VYCVASYSPFDPGARPSSSSEARILMCESKASGVMTSSAGLSFSATLSSAKSERVNKMKVRKHKQGAFIAERVVAPLNLLPFFARAGRRFLCLAAFDADLFQERLNRLFAPEKFLDRHRH